MGKSIITKGMALTLDVVGNYTQTGTYIFYTCFYLRIRCGRYAASVCYQYTIFKCTSKLVLTFKMVFNDLLTAPAIPFFIFFS